ncbi:MAG: nucleotidyltransferase family protein [Pirellulales bacterium]
MSTPRSFAIVPAAGRSERMGRPKLLLPWRGATVIEHVLSAWKRAGVSRVVVVVHPEDQALAAVCRDAGVDVVVADPPPADMKASVQCGLAHVASHYAPSASDAWLLAPADMPLLEPGWIEKLLSSRRPAPDEIIVASCQGRRGHPVLFAWPLAREAAELMPDEGLNVLLDRHPCRRVELPSEVLGDLDTPGDYQRLPHGRDRP